MNLHLGHRTAQTEEATETDVVQANDVTVSTQKRILLYTSVKGTRANRVRHFQANAAEHQPKPRGTKKKAHKPKVTFVESDVEPKPRRLLNFIRTASGMFVEEPMTPPPIDRFGFKVTPMTPVRKDFQMANVAGPSRRQPKRRSIAVEEPALHLPKPKWLNNENEAIACGSAKRRKICQEATDSILQPVNKPRVVKCAKALLPLELIEFRKTNLYRKGIPRQDAGESIRQQNRRKH